MTICFSCKTQVLYNKADLINAIQYLCTNCLSNAPYQLATG